MSVAELAAGSDLCALVTVTGDTVKEDPSGDVRTFIHYRVKVDRPVFGKGPSEFEIRIPAVKHEGGAVPFPGSPGFSPGSSWVVFLKNVEARAGTYDLISTGQGAIRVVVRSTGDGPVAIVKSDTPGEARPAAVLVQLPDLIAQIEAVRSNLEQEEGGR